MTRNGLFFLPVLLLLPACTEVPVRAPLPTHGVAMELPRAVEIATAQSFASETLLLEARGILRQEGRSRTFHFTLRADAPDRFRIVAERHWSLLFETRGDGEWVWSYRPEEKTVRRLHPHLVRSWDGLLHLLVLDVWEDAKVVFNQPTLLTISRTGPEGRRRETDYQHTTLLPIEDRLYDGRDRLLLTARYRLEEMGRTGDGRWWPIRIRLIEPGEPEPLVLILRAVDSPGPLRAKDLERDWPREVRIEE